jgi:hypothetical protein
MKLTYATIHKLIDQNQWNLTQEIVRELLDYDQWSGFLFWKYRDCRLSKTKNEHGRWNTQYAGTRAFTAIESNGYHRGRIFKKIYPAYQVIYLWMTGAWADPQVDHENHIRNDNRWSNLKESAENSKNASLRHDNKSGMTGVYWLEKYNRWCAQISADGTRKHLGYFGILEEAIAARQAANIKYGYHRNHGT